MTIVHIVSLEFLPTVEQSKIDEASQHLLALKTNCIHPQTQKPYMKASHGGVNNSPEGRSNGLTHIFVMEFDNEEDRKYYLESDPAHLAFTASLKSLVKNLTVLDFTPGVF